ncbi:hypothetical protein HUS74_06880 [Pandoraea nosoerga]|nr:hypothetical protein [Pandoraea nosoerga]
MDNELSNFAKRLIDMAFLAKGVSRAPPRAVAAQRSPIYPQILCSSLWISL